MHAAQISTTNALGAFLTVVAAHPLLERLFFASVELAVLAVLVFAAIYIGRIRSARLASILWLLVLAKPLVSLAIGSPVPLVRMPVPEVAAVVPAPEPKLEQVTPQPPLETPKPHDRQPDADDMGQAVFEPQMQPQLPADVTPAQTMLKPTAAEPIVAESSVPGPQRGPVPSNVPTIMLAVWLCGVAVFVLRSLIDRIRVWRLVRGARVPDADLLARYSSVATQLGLKRPVPVRVTSDLEGPALVGSLFATVLIPDWLAADANPARLNWALRHELMHWKLRDPLAGLVREFAQMLFHFHPAAWWAGHRWEVAAEQACDRAIVTSAADSADYAEQLYGILVGMQGRLRARIGNGLFATRTQIGQRIAALLNGPLTPRAHLSALALVAVTVVGAVTLSIGGAFADRNAERNEADKAETTQPVASNDKPDEKPEARPQEKWTLANAAQTVSNAAAQIDVKPPEENAPFVYAGTVLDGTGKPVAGAKLTLDHGWSALPPEGALPSAVSDATGHFQFSVPERGAGDAWAKSWWVDAMLVATKDGYGLSGGPSVQFESTGRLATLQQQRMSRAPERGTNVLKLAPDDVLIRGRLLDADGRPVAGAPVQTINVWEGRDGSWRAWERKAELGTYKELLRTLRALTDSKATAEARPSVLPPVRTDAEGWFTLRGIGRDRLADVLVSGPRLETTVLHVRSARGAVIKGLGPENVLYPCEFTRVIGRSTAVEGQIVDAASKQPVAGVLVRRRRDPPGGWVPEQYFVARTNTEGRYRLGGLPIGRNVLEIVPPAGSPFIPQFFLFATRFSRVPAIANVTLAHGTLVRGRATDARTGRAVQGAVDYFAFRNNPALAGAVNPPRQGNLLNTGIRSDENGVFEIAALPGPGIVAFRADRQDEFPWGQGADRVHGPTVTALDRPDEFLFSTAPFECGSGFYHLLTPVDPAPGAASLALDFTLRSIAMATVKVLSPDGKPLSDYSIFDDHVPLGERGASWRWASDGTFEVSVYSPTDRHRLLIYQRKLNLAGYYELTGEPAGPLEIKLQPAAKFVGRLVDSDGKPLPAVAIAISLRTGSPKNSGAESDTNAIDQKQIKTDEQGRFEVHRVIPGLLYSAEAIGSIEDTQHRKQPPGAIFKDVTADAGQTRNLGDLQIAMIESKTTATLPTRADKSAVENVVRGRVLLPDGKPAAGARVLALRRFWSQRARRTSLARTIAGAAGEFTLRVPKMSDEQAATYGNLVNIAAEFSGFGTQWQPMMRDKTAKEIVLKLVAEVPIHGRIVDLEGKPVRDARVTLLWQGSPKPDFGAWLERVKSGSQESFGRALLAELVACDDEGQAPILTDPDGRFTVRGLGADRVVNLAVGGESVAYAQIDLVTRPIKPFSRKDWEETVEVFGTDFTYHALPTRPIVGTVRDATSGTPLSGVRVEGEHGVIAIETDSSGKYRLIGMPKGGRGRADTLVAACGEDQPYFRSPAQEVPEKPGLDPVTIDFQLTRGIWITGRVTDKATGAPTLSQVFYVPAAANPNAAKFDKFDHVGIAPVRITKPDGSFRHLALPGRGIVWARALRSMYGSALPRSKTVEPAVRDAYSQLQASGFGTANALHVFDAIPGRENIACDLVLDPGGVIPLSIVDPAGKPVRDCIYVFETEGGRGAMTFGAVAPFEIRGMLPNESRGVLFRSAKPNIGKVQVLHYDDKAARRPVMVKLEPYATIMGRLLDEEGAPLKFANVQVTARGETYILPPFASGVESGADGRFVVRNVAAGGEYYTVTADRRIRGSDYETLADKLTISAGQTIDLGEIKLKRQNMADRAKTTASAAKPAAASVRQPASTAVEESKADVNVIRGRVLLPDGKPAAGARVLALRRYWTAFTKRRPLGRGVAGRDGRFTISIPKNQPFDGTGTTGGGAWIAAVADGFGAQCEHWDPAAKKAKEVVLKLVPEWPIHGQIVDLEGRPVANVSVQVEMQETPSLGMDVWLKAAKSGKKSEMLWLRIGLEMPGHEDEADPPLVTDADGRFTVRGAGADRVVRLGLHGETIAYAELDVVTRAIARMPRRGPFAASGELYGSNFTYQAAPTQPIVGTLRDASSGAPLPGVIIESRYVAGAPQALPGILRTVTDAQGNYRLVGMPKGNGGSGDQSNAIAVLPNAEQPYFMLNWLKVPQTAGLAPTRLDFKLTRGVWITGRVTDKATGEAVVPTRLAYIPSQKNSLAAGLPEFKRNTFSIWDLDRNLARADGSFRLVGLQGPGLVAAWAVGRSYRVGAGASEIAGMTADGKYPSFWGFDSNGANAMKEINPPPGATDLACDLAFDAGGMLRVSIVDETGKPAGACYYSFQPHSGSVASDQAKNSTLELSGLGHNESRPLLIMQTGRRVGKVLLARNDDKAARGLTVKLEPCATIKGRLLDSDGNPFEGIRLSAAAYGPDYWLPAGQARSEPDGRFVLDTLPPGAESYWVATDGFDNEVGYTKIAEKLTVGPGKTLDLGDIKLKRKK